MNRADCRDGSVWMAALAAELKRIRLTDRFVKFATTGGRKSPIFMDEEVNGFGIQVRETGRKRVNARLHVRRSAPTALRRRFPRLGGSRSTRTRETDQARARSRSRFSKRAESIFAALHESESGTSETSDDVQAWSAKRRKTDVSGKAQWPQHVTECFRKWAVKLVSIGTLYSTRLSLAAHTALTAPRAGVTLFTPCSNRTRSR